MNLFLTVLVLMISAEIGLCRNNHVRKETNANKNADTFEYFTRNNHVIKIPVVIHLDKAFTRTLPQEYKSRTRQKIKNKFRHVLNNVEILFKRQSLNQSVQFTLLDVKFLKNDTKKFVMDENVSSYLRSYCRWQGERKQQRKKWYYSILFTGLDVFYYGRNNVKVRSSTGRGYMKGICSLRNSCTLLEWQRTNMALKLAHEIGHSLGIPHDGAPYNQCRADQHIMSPKYNRNNPAKTWSPCSKQEFQQFLTSRYSWCLRPGSEHRNYIF